MRVKHALMAAVALSSAAWRPASALDWPQWLGPERDGVWREDGILNSFPPDGPAVKWRAQVGSGYAGPAVANGRVYLMDRQLAPGAANPSNPFERGQIPGEEGIGCWDADTGERLWIYRYNCPYTVSYPAGPRTTPVVADGKVWALGAEGDLHCLDAQTGARIWRRDFKADYGVGTPLWGFAAHPLVDGNRLICLVGGDEATVVAFDKNTGRELWRALNAKEPGYAPPTIIEASGRRQLIIWHPEAVNSLNPETGEVYWSYPWRIRSNLSVSTPRKSDQILFLTAFYNGSMALRLDAEESAASLIWKSKKSSEKDTDALHSIISTPFVEDGYVYGVCSYGQLRCLRLADGERLWETFAATTDGEPVRWANAFLVKHEDRFFLFNEKGDLILARLTPQGYQELGRAHILEPTHKAAGRDVLWSHPAFAERRMYARNDKELICVSLAAPLPSERSNSAALQAQGPLDVANTP